MFYCLQNSTYQDTSISVLPLVSVEVEKQLLEATEALRREDRILAKQVLKGDKRINKLEAELNEAAIKILALRQPVAADLRNVVMTLKMASHLERIGDYTKNTFFRNFFS